jgi:hypothetical protein
MKDPTQWSVQTPDGDPMSYVREEPPSFSSASSSLRRRAVPVWGAKPCRIETEYITTERTLILHHYFHLNVKLFLLFATYVFLGTEY